MRAEVASMHRVTRFSFPLTARQKLLEADGIGVGSAAPLRVQEGQQVRQAVDPDGYEIRATPEDAVFGAIAVPRSVHAQMLEKYRKVAPKSEAEPFFRPRFFRQAPST